MTTEGDVDKIGRATRRGISWSVGGAVITNLVRLVSVAALGRLLDARDFGVVAAATSILLVLHNVRDLGLGSALVQRATLDPEHERTAFATAVYLGFALALSVVAFAPWIGDLYRIPESVDVLRALGVIFALRGLATVSQMLCQRAMRFRAIALVDATSYAAGSATSISLATLGFGAWSIVVGYLVEETIAATLYLTLSRPRVGLRIRMARLRELLGFGLAQTVIQLGGVFATQGDNFVVGHSLGASALGFYARAYDLIKFPSAVFTTVVGNVLFPAFSKLQSSPERLAEGFRRVTFVNALVLIPASALLVVIAPETIRILMGAGWDDAVLPFRILVVTMVFRTNYKIGWLVASAAGAVRAIAIAHVIYMLCVIGGAAIAIGWGTEGVATSTAISITIVYLACSYVGIQVSKISIREVAFAHVPGLVLAVLVGAVIWPFVNALRSANLPATAIFAMSTSASIVVCVLGVMGMLRRARGDFGWLHGELGRVRRKFRRGKTTSTTTGDPVD